MTKFKHFPTRPKKLTAEFAKEQYEKLLARLPEAEKADSPDKWIALFDDWNALDSYVGSEYSRISYSFARNMKDKAVEKADEYFREVVMPAISQPDHDLIKALVASKHLDALNRRYGEMLSTVYEIALKPSDPTNIELRTKKGALDNQYEKIISGGSVMVNGEKMTLYKARSILTSPDSKLRKEAFIARDKWFSEHRDKLADIFEEMVGINSQMAKNVGYNSYTPLAYESMGRTDYDEKMVAQFRNNVKEYVVPVYKMIVKQQAEALGTPTLKIWDRGYNPVNSLPAGAVQVDTQLDKASQLFGKLSPWLKERFDYMRANDLIDLEDRQNKRTPAFCTGFSDQGATAILCNSVGDSDDISTLTHEMGHAFQGWASEHIEAVALQHPTADLCEVHSMGMEFLSLPYMETFFDEQNAKKFTHKHWEEVINAICYICAVDEFQHWIYKNPNSGSDKRDDQWVKIFDAYMPGVDWGNYAESKKNRWYGQSHIFVVPFYYIDYALAETAAMQLALIDSKDHKKALDTYLELCRIGGTKSILNALKAADLRSPFEEKLMIDLMDYAKSVLETK